MKETRDSVGDVLIYFIDSAGADGMNAVYKGFFSGPCPNRAPVVVKELLSSGVRIEIVVYAHVGPAN